MRKIFTAALVSAVILTASAVSASASVPTGTGSFRVPNAGLSTDWIYEGDSNRWQSVVNDPSSSCLLRMPDCEPILLADHKNQDFARLFDVEEGDPAVMTYADGTYDVFVCSGVIEGFNADYYLATLDGVPVQSAYYSDLIAYTCMRSPENPNGTLITLWTRPSDGLIVDDEALFGDFSSEEDDGIIIYD